MATFNLKQDSLHPPSPQRSSWSVDLPWVPRNWQTKALLAGSAALIGYGLIKQKRKGLATGIAGAALMYRGIAMFRDPDAGLWPHSAPNVEDKALPAWA